MSASPKTANDPSNRRRILLINTRFQVSMMIYAVLMITLVSAIFYFYETFFLFQISEIVMDKAGPESELMRSIETLHSVVFPWFVLAVIATALIIMSFITFLSHRIAGPIYHAEMYLNQIAKDPSKKRRIKFREKDYFHELAAAVNAAIPTDKIENGNIDKVRSKE